MIWHVELLSPHISIIIGFIGFVRLFPALITILDSLLVAHQESFYWKPVNHVFPIGTKQHNFRDISVCVIHYGAANERLPHHQFIIIPSYLPINTLTLALWRKY